MSSATKKLLDGVGGRAMAAFQRSLERKTPEQIERTGVKLGRLFYTLGKKRRHRAISNLELAMPQLSEADRHLIAKRVFEHFGRTTTDFLASRNRTQEELQASINVVGISHLHEALARGKGVIMVGGHIGNWERASSWISYNGHPLSVVIRDADQSDVNQLVNSLRTKSGTRIIPRGNAAKPILERLRANQIVGILSDQNAEDIFLPFFGHPAGTNLGVGVIHERTNASILPGTCLYIGPNQYELKFYPLLVPQEGYSIKGEGLLRAINFWLESVITEHPEQWLWFHDRWRNAREAGLL